MSDQKNDKILEVKNLKVSYHTYAGEVKSVRGVSFDLKEGEAIAIVGESGCGKSVTAKSIMGLIKGPQGEIKQAARFYITVIIYLIIIRSSGRHIRAVRLQLSSRMHLLH